MIISKSVNRHLAQSDYINISKNFYVLDIYVYLTLSSTVETILGNTELLLISLNVIVYIYDHKYLSSV